MNTNDCVNIESVFGENIEFYRTVVETTTDAIVIIDEESTILSINKSAERIFGYTAQEMISQKLTMVMPDHLRQKFLDGIRRYMETGIESKSWIRTQFPGLHKSGKEILIEGSYSEFVKDDKHFFTGICRDITELKQAKDALRESEERFRETFDRAAVGFAHVSLEGKFLLANQTLCKILGYTTEELKAITFYSITHPDDLDNEIESIRQMLAGKIQSYSVEQRYRRKDSSIARTNVSVSLVRDTDGNPKYYIFTVEEITARNRIEEKEYEQIALLNIAQDAILVRNLEGRILFWNNGAEHIYGWTAEEAIGKDANLLLYRETSAQRMEAFNSIIENERWTGELHQVTKTGNDVIVESRWSLVRDNDGNPKSILVVNTDITEKKRLEGQFFRAQRMESIGTIASGIAHDLNNILAPILLSIEFLRMAISSEREQRTLDTLEATTLRGAELVKQILSFARGMESKKTIIQPGQVISEVEKVIRETFPRSIRIVTDTPEDLWTISADSTQLHQVLMNLCVNSRDAMPQGGALSISARNFLIDKNYTRMDIEAKIGPYVLITVSDTGTGMSKALLDKIFDPFFTTKEFGKGTGLGLPTVVGIVKGHGGFLKVYSELGRGSEFKIYLPAQETVETEQARKARTGLPVGNGEAILVVDDEASIREITKASLEAFNYRVLTAGDGVEALAAYTLHRSEVSVVLLDMMMPIMDGLATIRALKRMNPRIKIIAVSGLSSVDKIDGDILGDIETFLSKPYTTEELLGVLQIICNDHNEPLAL